MGVRVGGFFDRKAALVERLHQGPGVQAQEEVGVGLAEGPPPSRWSLRTIRVSVPWWGGYSLSGVWRHLQGQGLALRSARVQHYSPDPEYRSKLDYLKDCLGQAAQHPKEVVLVFLDEMGYYRWPAPAADWTGQELTPVAQRGGPNNQQWRLIGTRNACTGQVDYLDD